MPLKLPSLRLPGVRMPSLPAPSARAEPADYAETVEAIKPALPRLDETEFFEWLKSRRRAVFLFGPPGTGKTYHATLLAAAGRVTLPGGIAVALYDAGAGGLLPCAGYFTVSMAHDAERRWRQMLGAVCDGQVATIHGLAVRSIGLGLRVFPVVYRDVEGRYRPYRVPGSKAVLEPDVAQEVLRAEAAGSAGLKYSLDPYRQEAGNYVFHLFDYTLHVGGLPALREAYRRLDYRGRETWRRYLRLLGWGDALIGETLSGRAASLCEAAGGAHELWRALAGGRVRLDFSLVVEAARCLRQPYEVRCGRRRVKPKVLMLDEFQDLSPALRNLVARIFDAAEYVVLAGDDDQLIYDSLHGASVDVTLKIVEMIQRGETPGEYHVLARSFRLPEEPLARLARRIIEQEPNRVKKVWRGREDVKGELRRVPCERLEEHVERELAAGHRVFALTADNATALSVMMRLHARGFIVAGLKGLPARLRQLYKELYERLTQGTLLDVAKRADHEIVRFLEAIKGRERETAQLLKLALDRERELERLEKLRLFVDTVHASKGLEVDAVFVINSATSERPAGNRRLAYVALSRARKRVYVVECEGGHRWLADL
ncbi:MAG: ATP-binding domain-containing protein [Thermoproteaceae archaeon]|nr:ATP-binding domain-containing protein [Thermoproteaceae archaeon]